MPSDGIRLRREGDPRPIGRVSSSSVRTASHAFAASRVGGNRRLSFATVEGSNTLPALTGEGSPSMPVTANCGRQVRLSTSSVRSLSIGDMPALNGNFV